MKYTVTNLTGQPVSYGIKKPAVLNKDYGNKIIKEEEMILEAHETIVVNTKKEASAFDQIPNVKVVAQE